MPVATTTFFKVGDLVTPNPEFIGVPASQVGRVYRVTKVNPKNIQAAPLDDYPGARGINYPRAALLLADGVESPLPAIARAESFPLPLAEGTLVTLSGGFPKWGWTDTTPLVVLADKGARVNVAGLFGGHAGYVRCSRRSLTERDAAWLAAALTA